MRVIIDHQLFVEPTLTGELVELFHNVNRLPHQLLINGEEEGAAHKDRWLRSVGALAPSLEQILIRGRSPERLRKPPAVTLLVTNQKDEAIDLEGKNAVARLARAKDLVREPLKLWLENGINDSAFLQTVAPAGQFRKWLEDAKDNAWIEYVHGGGSDLGKNLKMLDPWQRLRAWAMSDSDCWEPGRVSPQLQSFRRVSEAKQRGPEELPLPALPLQVLRRRAIENYLPSPALKRWATLRHNTTREQRKTRLTFAKAVDSLDTHAATFRLRHHYHMEKGFRSEPEKIPADYEPFRANEALERGIGPSIKKVFKDNLDTREAGGSGWLSDDWFAPDDELREEFEGIIESIQNRI